MNLVQAGIHSRPRIGPASFSKTLEMEAPSVAADVHLFANNKGTWRDLRRQKVGCAGLPCLAGRTCGTCICGSTVCTAQLEPGAKSQPTDSTKIEVTALVFQSGARPRPNLTFLQTTSAGGQRSLNSYSPLEQHQSRRAFQNGNRRFTWACRRPKDPTLSNNELCTASLSGLIWAVLQIFRRFQWPKWHIPQIWTQR